MSKPGYNSEVDRLRTRCLAIVSRFQAAPAPSTKKLCHELLELLTEEAPRAKKVLSAAQILGQHGGLKGGHARAQAMTKEERVASARVAANKRWAAVRDAKAREAETDAERAVHGDPAT